MKAIILAAGQGSRLKPLTNNLPKCMVDLFGKPLIKRQIEVFHSCGIKDISVITGYKKEKIVLEDVYFFHNSEFNNTNMVETLFCAREKLFDDVIISYGDIIFQKNILHELISSPYDISVIVDKSWKKYWQKRFTNILTDAESMEMDNDGFIQSIGQKTENVDDICGQYIGLMKFSKNGINSVIEFYDNVKKISIETGVNPLNDKLSFEKSYMTDFLQGLIDNGNKIKAINISNNWLELDTMDDFSLYNKLYKNKEIFEFYNPNT